MDITRLIKSLALLFFMLTQQISLSHSKRFGLRHKRQHGADLYLPESFIIPGGDGDASEWGAWSSPSECSRTCGGGVSYQSRECLKVGQNGEYNCDGGDKKYFSCNTQDCSEAMPDFRQQQCSNFDRTPFEGVQYNWVPYTKAPNPCELNCMPRGERFYYRHRSKVIDGTRCNDASVDVCVDGTCQAVGCNLMLGSPAREDKCRKCQGDGSSCKTVNGLLDMNNLQVGYNDILLIPAGATNIEIQERSPSNNYLGIRNLTGHYYLNGNYRIDFPRPMNFAGSTWTYERKPNGFAAPDRLSCMGPTVEPVYLVLLSQDQNVGVNYEYSVPQSAAPEEPDTYSWTFTKFEACSVSCGGGHQSRNVTCNSQRTLETVDESLCDSSQKPAEWQKCGFLDCAPQWIEGEWGKCSAPCGQNGTRERSVKCEQIAANGASSVVDDNVCLDGVGNKPANIQSCNEEKICPIWFTSEWQPCNKLCGEGKQTRQVICYRKEENGRITVLDDKDCQDTKPEAEKDCLEHPCEGVDYITSMWSGCDSCGSTTETRTVHCASKTGKVYDEKFCEKRKKPELSRACVAPPCEHSWFSSQWTKCNAVCGNGTQSRTVVCGKFDGSSIKQAEESNCEADQKPEAERECAGPEECPAQWFAGPWTDCTKPCGDGVRDRKVLCIANNLVVEVTKCAEDKIIYANEKCNVEPCSEDDLIPLDTTSKPIEEDDEGEDYCDENEDLMDLTEDSILTTKSGDMESTSEDSATEGTASNMDESTDVSGVSKFTDEMESTTDVELETGVELSSTGSSGTSGSSGTTETTLETEEFMLSDSTGDGSDESTTDHLTTDGSGDIEGSGSSIPPVDEEVGFPSRLLSTDEEEEEDDDISVPTTEDSTTGLSSTVNTPLSSSVSSLSSSVPPSTTDASDTSSASATGTETTVDETTMTPTEPTTEETSETSTDTSTETSTDSSSKSSTTDDSTTISLTTVDTTDSDSTASSIDSKSSSGTTVSSDDFKIETSSFDYSTEFTSTEISTPDSGSSTTSDGTEATETTDTTVTEITESTQSTEESSTDATESTVTVTEGSTVTESTEATESTESPGSTDSTIESDSTTSSDLDSTTVDIWSSTNLGDTTDDELETGGTTPNTYATFTKAEQKPRKCKPRPKKPSACIESKYGCCSDNKTAAIGPFDEGCPMPETCKDTKYNCCSDGLTPAKGTNGKGCPKANCKDTLFGCCPDETTPSQGNDNDGCPVPTTTLKPTTKLATTTTVKTESRIGEDESKPDEKAEEKAKHCSESTHGCCPDGVMEATGRDFEGCPVKLTGCFASAHGCCQDNRTAATGPKQAGCSPCITSQFGCCPDAETPAHGPQREGCCLLTTFGCCPDNVNAASGPQLEGCGCEYSPYGCCPDGKTSAKYYENEGCGCKFAPHGCCPDQVTAANGAKFEGCACHTFQFGCCPDGVTVSTGPHNQGCHCSHSEHKCCSDNITPAKGPNFEGCTCATSQYGCCQDGTSEAQGIKFEGCEIISESPQKACSLKRDMGPCNDNFSVKYFFDTEYGGCSRFWYGGCEGNKNRFDTNEECKDVCEQPTGKDICNLPQVHGPCTGYYPMYSYDSDRNTCSQFIYGGCLGNANRFEKIEDCQATCSVDEKQPPCDQPIEAGPCSGSFERWAFDKERDQCIPFNFGGCKGNKNNYQTESACNYNCKKPGVGKQSCNLPKENGDCGKKHARWSFSEDDNKCMPFYYTGCGGNENNYETETICAEKCPAVIVKDLCQIPADVGDCQNYIANWYYDTKISRCRQFYYGGCGGNDNRFTTDTECEKRCSNRNETPAPKPQTRGTSPPERATQPERVTQAPTRVTQPAAAANQKEICLMDYESGNCREQQRRYYYDSGYGVCSQFLYTGCDGNGNNFETLDECESSCHDAQSPCVVAPLYGRCSENITKWHYDEYSSRCLEFVFSGCYGNKNNFDDQQSCERTCNKRTEPEETRSTQAARRPSTRDQEIESRFGDTNICNQERVYGECEENHLNYFFDRARGSCEAFYYSGCGGNGNRFTSQEQCSRQCGQYRGVDVCNHPVEVGPCDEYTPRYAYDTETRSCSSFNYGGCNGNGNRFISQFECESVCISHEEPTNSDNKAICALPAVIGRCESDADYHKRWFYDDLRGTCLSFIYTGCAGNQNNFRTFESCLDFCRPEQEQVPRENAVPVSETKSDCEQFIKHCDALRCPYGVMKSYDSTGCERCECEDPCRDYDCPADSQCSVDVESGEDGETVFVAVCRQTIKNGRCPRLEESRTCVTECNSDADCRGDSKCCSAGCSSVCVLPASERERMTTQSPYYNPEARAPTLQRVSDRDLQPTAREGAVATLRCFATGFPPPTITWKRGGLELKTNQGRLVLTAEGDLQIVQLHRTDAGTYVCVAYNGIGSSVEREINLTVDEPKEASAYILGSSNTTVLADLDQPATLRCLAGGQPKPTVYWWRGTNMLPYKTDRFEVTREFSLVFEKVELHDLGPYVCQAYNSIGKPVSIQITLKARGPVHVRNDEDRKYLQYIDSELPKAPSTTPRQNITYPYRPTSLPTQTRPPPVRVPQQTRIPQTQTRIPQTQPRIPQTQPRIIPVTANILMTKGNAFSVSTEILLNCNVSGEPQPEITWYKDDQSIALTDRITIDEPHRLLILNAQPSDSGRYRCLARNEYSEAFAEEDITVEGQYVPSDCNDNQFFANCALIVKGNYCTHKYYAKFCCRSCTLAGFIRSHPNEI